MKQDKMRETDSVAEQPDTALSTSTGQEIDPGFHKVFQNGNHVGNVYVQTVVAGTMREHWRLFSGFTRPSSSNTDVSMRFMYQEGMDLDDFNADAPNGSTHIISTCIEQ